MPNYSRDNTTGEHGRHGNPTLDQKSRASTQSMAASTSTTKSRGKDDDKSTDKGCPESNSRRSAKVSIGLGGTVGNDDGRCDVGDLPPRFGMGSRKHIEVRIRRTVNIRQQVQPGAGAHLKCRGGTQQCFHHQRSGQLEGSDKYTGNGWWPRGAIPKRKVSRTKGTGGLVHESSQSLGYLGLPRDEIFQRNTSGQTEHAKSNREDMIRQFQRFVRIFLLGWSPWSLIQHQLLDGVGLPPKDESSQQSADDGVDGVGGAGTPRGQDHARAGTGRGHASTQQGAAEDGTGEPPARGGGGTPQAVQTGKVGEFKVGQSGQQKGTGTHGTEEDLEHDEFLEQELTPDGTRFKDVGLVER